MDYDEDRIYYSYQNLQSNNEKNRPDRREEGEGDRDSEDADLQAVRRHFREFLRNYRQKHRYVYRDKLLKMHQRTSGDEYTPRYSNENVNPNDVSIEVDLAHIAEYDTALLDLLLRQPAHVLPPFEKGAADALKTLLYEKRQKDTNDDMYDPDADMAGADSNPEETRNNNSGDNGMPDNNTSEDMFHGSNIQIQLKGNLGTTPIRSIAAQHMNKLVRCPGIIISAAKVRSRATAIRIRCSRCQDMYTIHSTSGPFSGVNIPKQCRGPNPQECGPSPYAVVPDQCTFVDQQTLKLQEAPEAVPTGEMPRSVLLAVERSMVDQSPPGTRVTILAIPSLFTAAGGSNSGGGSVKSVYLRVLGLKRSSETGGHLTYTPREEEAFRILARRPDVYDIISRSIAPSISGSYTIDIKKALACQLFSGTRKKLPDGMRLRGDINVLLLGDPSMAKSQFLKYITRVAPVAVYTSGKGSSAAGLTASVVRDQRGEFYLEGGAMVLADGGIVAIDEFDKMRPADRVAIHEAMEQQTISVAKAGITTVLNSRSSVLAAANPVFGRDIRDEERDSMICHHVMGVHINNSRGGKSIVPGQSNVSEGGSFGDVDGVGELNCDGTEDNFGGASGINSKNPEALAENAMRVATTGIGELDVATMKKYIHYCKVKCSPRLSEEAGDVLASSYVKIRDDVRRRILDSSTPATEDNDQNGENDNQAVIPITVRQLEALVRLSESLAKMRLEDEVQAEDVAEALRLFKVSTMAANSADTSAVGNIHRNTMLRAGSSREEMLRTETYLRSRLAIGSTVNKQRIVEEAVSQGYNAIVVARAISVMVMRGEVQERNQSRLIKRIKF